MKKVITVIPVLLLCVLGAGLGLGSARIPLSPEENLIAASIEYEAPVYQMDTMTAENVFAAGDGRELAHYSYQLLTLTVPNLQELSPADAELARRNMDNFNDRMIGLMDESVEVGLVMGEDALAVYDEFGGVPDYYDETTAAGRLAGQLISVRVDHSSYAGGAHPNTHAYSYLFDLQIGQFIDPAQIADDPGHFRAGAVELLLEKADALENNRSCYWSDYAETIARWNEGTVLFDADGMLAVYSPYGLGPYTMGEVALRLSWEELAELVGPGGLERLGAAERSDEG